MWFSKPKPLVDLDEFDWLLACFAWVHRKMGPDDAKVGFKPMLARHDSPGFADAKDAAGLFIAVKEIAGLSNWHCELQQGEPAIEPVSFSPIGEFSSRSAIGTFSIEGNTPIIRYDPALLADSERLTATFAHELAHLLGHTLGLPPGGEELEEHATDCIAVYLGFGVFLSNSARNFSQFSDGQIQGWQSSMAGYLSEQALVTLTAMFVRLFEYRPELASELMKPYLRTDFAKALKHLDHSYPNLAEDLAALDLDDWA